MFSVFLSFVASKILFFALHLENSSFPKPLSKSDEFDAFLKMHNGNKQAREKLISHNLRLVAHIAKKYYTTTCTQEDIISIGIIGLIKAVDSYQSERGNHFSTYAARCIENEILMYFRAGKKEQPSISIYDSIDKEQSGTELTVNDVIADNFRLEDAYEDKEETENIHNMLKKLSKREQNIIIMRYGLFGNKSLTQQEIADKLNISRSYVSRLESHAIKVLRNSKI